MHVLNGTNVHNNPHKTHVVCAIDLQLNTSLYRTGLEVVFVISELTSYCFSSALHSALAMCSTLRSQNEK